MLHATVVTTNDELDQIYQLNRQNLKEALSSEEKEDQGFVTWLYSIELLQSMHELAPSIVVKESDRVVGYALVLLKEACLFHTDLKAMMDHINSLAYKGQVLSAFSFYVMGQICIHKDYRGKGVFNMLYQHHKELYSRWYRLLITEISTSNRRSQRAHERIGFRTIYTYRDVIDEWNVVVWDWE